MLVLEEAHLDAIYRHGEETFPQECCGLLLGTMDGTRREAHRVVRARNINTDRAEDRYEIHPADRLQAEGEAASSDLAVIGVYHSHPDHDACFSETDLQGSEEYRMGQPWLPPAYSYVVVSIRSGKRAARKSFIVVEGSAEEETIELR